MYENFEQLIDIIDAAGDCSKVADVTFTKLDGTQRRIVCELKDGWYDETRAVVYDVELRGYRTIMADAISEVYRTA
jgi:hypothetical protein